jgi:AcrR family transcriptional regulator
MLREEILETAQVLLVEHGYAAMSMDDLAARAGISKPTLYRYFPSKEEVAVEVAVRRMRWLADQIEHSPPGLSPLGRLLALLRSVIELHLSHQTAILQEWSPELFRVVCEREGALEGLQRIHTTLRAIVQAAIDAGEIDPALTVDAVVMSFYSMSGAPKLARFHRLGLEVETAGFTESLLTLFERGVRKSSAPLAS